MKHLYLTAFMLLVICAIHAQDTNLIVNGDFKDYFDNIPAAWTCPSTSTCQFKPDGGPNGLPCMVLHEGGGKNYENKLRENCLTLVPGERYKISAWIKTTGFASRNYGLIIANQGWFEAVGIQTYPETSDWTYYEKEVTCIPSKDTTKYDFIFYTVGQKGKVEIADVKLLPLTPKAISDSRAISVLPSLTLPRIVPWGTFLNTIPLKHPFATFCWFGTLGKDFKPETCAMRLTTDTFTAPTVNFKSGEPFQFNLTGLAVGWHKATIAVIDANQKVLYQETFNLRVRDIPTEEEATQGKRLNNLTVELFNIQATPAAPITFSLPYDRWLYLTAPDGHVSLDGTPVIQADSLNSETFRQCEAGTHTITVSAPTRLIIRTIPDIFACPVLEGPMVTNFPKYSWDFAKQHILPATTTCNRGNPSSDILADAHRLGYIWTGNLDAVKLTTVDNMRNRIEKLLTDSYTRDGASADELFYNSPTIDIYTLALKSANYNRSKRLFTWVCSAPSLKSMHGDFIATCFNASNGEGKIIYEAYLRTDATEKEILDNIQQNIVFPFAESCKLYPNYARKAGIAFGNFNQIGVCSLEHHAEVDYKYYLDLQVHTVATNPVFKDMGLIGYWGGHYADEEMVRWSYKLLRHYVVEGNTDLLSTRYGFTYLPGHIVNNDFTDGLNGWQVEPAAEGSIKPDKCPKYGDIYQVRWGSGSSIGDTFCHFKTVQGKPNRISQTAHNLIPGKPYMLLCYVGDLDDIQAKRFNPHDIGISIDLTNATIRPEGTFVWIDNRKKGYSSHSNIPRQNLHRIIFTPTQSDVTITFSDKNAAPNANIMLNYIQLKPFFQP